jgi:hypothetical protein
MQGRRARAEAARRERSEGTGRARERSGTWRPAWLGYPSIKSDTGDRSTTAVDLDHSNWSCTPRRQHAPAEGRAHPRRRAGAPQSEATGKRSAQCRRREGSSSCSWSMGFSGRPTEGRRERASAASQERKRSAQHHQVRRRQRRKPEWGETSAAQARCTAQHSGRRAGDAMHPWRRLR